MGKIKVYAPNKAYAGTVGDIRFEAGVATVDERNPTMGYFRRRGYGIGEPAAPEASLPADKLEPTLDGTPIDARDYDRPTWFGSPLRDASVDPKPDDYLPPTNAGNANPHGPSVVSPGIHGVGPAPIRPGETFVDDTDRQETEETQLAQSVLVDGDPATDIGSAPGDDRGPLGLSDPGSVAMGQRDLPDGESATPEPAPAKKTTTTTKKASGPKGTTK